MPDESPTPTAAKDNTGKGITGEQASQASLAGAIGLIAGACTKDPTIKSIVAAIAPFISLGIFWLVRTGGEEFKSWRTQRGLDDYLRQIEQKIDRLTPGSPERLQLEADAREVGRMKHAYIVKDLTGVALPVTTSQPTPVAIVTAPAATSTPPALPPAPATP